jgi:hypothetical protein
MLTHCNMKKLKNRSVPWDLYRQAHERRLIFQQALQQHSSSITPLFTTATNSTASSSKNDATDSCDRDFKSETAKLQFMESKYLLFCLASPVMGGLLLEIFRRRMSTFLVLSQFDIMLFILAASIRPILLLSELSKQQIQELQVFIFLMTDHFLKLTCRHRIF